MTAVIDTRIANGYRQAISATGKNVQGEEQEGYSIRSRHVSM
jgi:hypothetical protein